jgi:hypothetical protein
MIYSRSDGQRDTELNRKVSEGVWYVALIKPPRPPCKYYSRMAGLEGYSSILTSWVFALPNILLEDLPAIER